ncbi:MAG: hypothetical protein ACFFC7_31920 [Candidatus Hermodarchaeota archaeon]
MTIVPITWQKKVPTELVNQLIDQANTAEGPQTYNGVKMRADEARMLKALERLLNVLIQKALALQKLENPLEEENLGLR